MQKKEVLEELKSEWHDHAALCKKGIKREGMDHLTE